VAHRPALIVTLGGERYNSEIEAYVSAAELPREELRRAHDNGAVHGAFANVYGNFG
jgi:hypothetical protein